MTSKTATPWLAFENMDSIQSPDILENFTTIDVDLETCSELADDDIVDEIKMKKSADALEGQEENDNIMIVFQF